MSRNSCISSIRQASQDLDQMAERLLGMDIDQLHMTPQAVVHALRLARIVADLVGQEQIVWNAVAEAIQYCSRFLRR